ncbi:transcriptional regulator [Phenylobacterium sp.]|uniref:helix-turn-helix domain-containing protein n=1 Tax=Phenylobacterium sp. TaxID=1871053 RepID=UPI00286D00B3|nr:transcriptional regulator [Phenylobacterium sp.]
MEPRPIHNETELGIAKAEVSRLWEPASPEEARCLDDWAVLIDAYEASAIKPAENLDPVSVIAAEMRMNGRSRADLAALLGQSRATEILSRKRPLTLPMIRTLSREWSIPAQLLIAEYATA